MPAKPSTPNGVQSLTRAFALLELLAEHHDAGLTLADLAIKAEIDRTTAHRMARFLEAAGYIERDPGSKRLHLGTTAMSLGLRAMNRPPPGSALVTKMKALARLTSDAVFLIVRIGDHGHCLHTEQGSHRIKSFHMLTGSSRLLGQGTGSMALLARLDNDAVRAHYERHRPEYEAGGLSLMKLMRGVERSRACGYALAGADGVAGVGYALPMAMHAEAAISIVSAVSRMPVARRHEMGRIIGRMFTGD